MVKSNCSKSHSQLHQIQVKNWPFQNFFPKIPFISDQQTQVGQYSNHSQSYLTQRPAILSTLDRLHYFKLGPWYSIPGLECGNKTRLSRTGRSGDQFHARLKGRETAFRSCVGFLGRPRNTIAWSIFARLILSSGFLSKKIESHHGTSSPPQTECKF